MLNMNNLRKKKKKKKAVLTYSGKCNKAKICRIEEWPMFPGAKQEGATKNVTNHQENA